MAQRESHNPDTWKPGDPLYTRPKGYADGQHVRAIFQCMPVLPGTPEHCWCDDRASWPTPLEPHDLASDRHVIVGLPFREGA